MVKWYRKMLPLINLMFVNYGDYFHNYDKYHDKCHFFRIKYMAQMLL